MNVYIGVTVLVISFVFVYFWWAYSKKFDLVAWFFSSFGLVFGFGLILSQVFFEKNSSEGYLVKEFSENYFFDAIIYLPMTFFLLLFTFIGAVFFNIFSKKLLFSLNEYIFPYWLSDSYNYRRICSIAYLMFFLSFFGYYLYVSPFGGFIEYLKFSAMVRSGFMDELPPNPFSFLIAFGGFSLISSYLFFSLLRSKFSFFCLVGFFISFLFSIYVLTSWMGRVAFLFYFMVFLMAFVIKPGSYEPRYRRLVYLSVFFLVFLFFINDILGRKASSSIFQLLSMELIFPFVSLKAAIGSVDSFRLGVDLLAFPIYLLPQRFWVDYLISAEHANTINIFGSPKGVAGNTSSVPTDIITISYLNFGYLGIIFVGFYTGFLLGLADFFCRLFEQKNLREVIYCYFVLNLAVLLPLYADPSHIASRFFPIIAFFCLILVSSTLKRFLKKNI